MRELTSAVVEQGASLSWVDLPGGRLAFEGDVLMLSHCTMCGGVQIYPTSHCVLCGAAVDRSAASGIGTVYSWTVIRKTKRAGFASATPYVVALIDLAEGPRVMGNVIVEDLTGMRVGMDVHMMIVNSEADRPILQWTAS